MKWWYIQATQTINEVIKKCMAEKNIGLFEIRNLTPEDKAKLRIAIDKAYPFGIKKYTPYKQWLKAKKEITKRIGV